MSRVANFSSSQNYRLMSKGRGDWSVENVGAPFHSYIKEKIFETRLGRSLTAKHSARPTSWGTFVEKRVFDLLSTEYQLISQDRYYHPEIKKWSGMPDAVTRDNKKVVDIKSPYTLLSFCSLVEILESGDPMRLKAEKPEYYWQLVSNSILTDCPIAELVVYVPYKHELETIKKMANDHSFDGHITENDVAFINFVEDSELPHVIMGEGYNNLYSFSWKVSKEDKELLTERVKMAVAELNSKLKVK